MPPTQARAPSRAGPWADAFEDDAADANVARSVVVTTKKLFDRGSLEGAEAIVVDGDARASLARAGWRARVYLPVPPDAPEAWLPVESAVASRYALESWLAGSTRLKRIRNRLLAGGIRARPVAGALPIVTIGSAADPVPFVLRAAAAYLAPGAMHTWLMTTGGGESADYRGVFHLFGDGAREPRLVVKFSRRPGEAAAFERDRRGFAAVFAAGRSAAAHVPALVASVDASGYPASVESAAVGRRLSVLLRSPAPASEKRAAIEHVAEWIVTVGRETRQPGGLEEEARRLHEEVVPAWEPFGAPADLVERVAGLPGVLQHHDLWCDNVIVDARGNFTVIDWEDARRAGLPLWDLVYFLADSLARFDGAERDDERRRHFRALFRGEARSSPLLFEWVRRGAAACGVPSEAVGPTVTLCWLSLVLLHVTRGKDAANYAVHGLSKLPPGEHWATIWLEDDLLGPDWPAWSAKQK